MSQPYNYYVGDGVTAAFQFTQPLNEKATVVGWENGAAVAGTWDSGTGFFTFTTAPVSGADVHVVRQTAQDLMYSTFPNKSYISSDNLDNNNRQLIELSEEIAFELDYRADNAATHAAAASASATAASASETAAASSETNSASSETAAAASAVDAAASAAAALPYRKNAIINGLMDIWERGTSILVSSSVYQYQADRFGVWNGTTGDCYYNRAVDSCDGGEQCQYALEVDVNTADVALAAGVDASVFYRVEGYDFAKWCRGRNVTLSFSVRSPKTGTYCIMFRNSGTDRSYVSEYTIDVANTWEQKSITVPMTETGGTWDYTNGTGLTIGWCLGTGTTGQTGTTDAWVTGSFVGTANQVNLFDNTANTFRLGGVQLEAGDAATTLEHTVYSEELLKCQRYFERLKSMSAYSRFGSGLQVATTDSSFYIPFNTTKRAAPVITHSANADFAIYNSAIVGPITSATVASAGLHGTGFNVTHAVTGAVGYGCMLIDNNSTAAYIDISSEL